MHAHHTANAALPPEIERSVRNFIGRWGDAIDPLAESLEAAIRAGDVELGTVDSIRAGIEPIIGETTADINILFREHSREAAVAGRTLAARRNDFDIRFDVIPQRTIDSLDDWTTTASQEVADTLEAEISQYLRGAQQEGLGVDEIADQFQDEFVDGRLTDWKADQLARDNTVAPANAGNESAIRDSGAIGKEWLTTLDGRQRETHGEAHRQVVGADQPFIVGGHRAQHPGDPQLPVKEFTQCRCQVRGVFESELTQQQIQTLRRGGRFWR